MKKQYRISEERYFKQVISIYHDGKFISSKEMWIDDVDEYIDELEQTGYTYGHTAEEVEEAKEIYEYKLLNLIEGEKDG